MEHPYWKALKYSLATLVLSSPMLPNPAYAVDDELPDFTEEDIFIDIPQVISATYLPQKLTEAPASISIIDQKTIKASGALKVSDLFRLVPGMQSFDVHTNKHGVTYHGMSNDFPNKLEVMINGRTVYIPLLSTVMWETLGVSVHDIDYIEVVRGSNVPTQGSNAFLGAINIVTRAPFADLNSELRTTHGALGTESYSIRHSSSTDAMNYSLNAGYHQNDGIDRFEDAGQNKYINFMSSFTPNLTDTIELQLGASKGYAYRGDGDSETADEAGFVQRDHDSNYQMINWHRVSEDNSEFSLSYYHNYLNLEAPTYSDDELQLLLENAFGPLPQGIGSLTNLLNPTGIYKDTEHGKMDLHDVEFRYNTSISNNSSFVLGTGARYQRVFSEALLADNTDWVDENRFRLFGNWEYKYDSNWVFNTGAMLENSDISGSAFSPRIAANYLIDSSSSIRASFTKAKRLPSLLELGVNNKIVFPLGAGTDINATPNYDLDPEENDSFEIGFIKIWPKYNTQFDLKVFQEKISQGIDSQFYVNPKDTFIGNPGIASISENIAQWRNKGFEFQLKSDLPTSFPSSIMLNYGYNNTKGERHRGQRRLSADQDIDSLDTRSPRHTASILLNTQPTKDISLGLAHYYVDHTEWLEGYSKGSPRNNYTRTDLIFGKDFLLDEENKLEMTFIVQNLFDKRYSEFYRYNDFDRRAYLQLKLTY